MNGDGGNRIIPARKDGRRKRRVNLLIQRDWKRKTEEIRNEKVR